MQEHATGGWIKRCGLAVQKRLAWLVGWRMTLRNDTIGATSHEIRLSVVGAVSVEGSLCDQGYVLK